MMDSRRFQGSFEHDFGSCGRQQNVCFQKFACTELNSFFWISFDCCLFKQIVCCQWVGGDWTERFFSQIETLLQGNTIGNANTELLVLTGWAAWQFAASRHDVLDW